jgi:hypothetical protein
MTQREENLEFALEVAAAVLKRVLFLTHGLDPNQSAQIFLTPDSQYGPGTITAIRNALEQAQIATGKRIVA